MSERTTLRRIERAEQAAKAQSRFSSDCICFPENEPPFFCSPTEEEIAAKVKCVLHGERFRRQRFFVYVSKWLRDKIPTLIWTHHTEQYRKAWFASFPPPDQRHLSVR